MSTVTLSPPAMSAVRNLRFVSITFNVIQPDIPRTFTKCSIGPGFTARVSQLPAYYLSISVLPPKRRSYFFDSIEKFNFKMWLYPNRYLMAIWIHSLNNEAKHWFCLHYALHNLSVPIDVFNHCGMLINAKPLPEPNWTVVHAGPRDQKYQKWIQFLWKCVLHCLLQNFAISSVVKEIPDNTYQSSHTVPHSPSCKTSTRPWVGMSPPTRRISIHSRWWKNQIQIRFVRNSGTYIWFLTLRWNNKDI